MDLLHNPISWAINNTYNIAWVVVTVFYTCSLELLSKIETLVLFIFSRFQATHLWDSAAMWRPHVYFLVLYHLRNFAHPASALRDKMPTLWAWAGAPHNFHLHLHQIPIPTKAAPEHAAGHVQLTLQITQGHAHQLPKIQLTNTSIHIAQLAMAVICWFNSVQIPCIFWSSPLTTAFLILTLTCDDHGMQPCWASYNSHALLTYVPKP